MFSKEHMSVIDWWVYFILMMIPVVNVILFIMVLLSSNANSSVRNLELALVLPILIFAGYYLLVGFPNMGFNGPF